MRNILTLAVLAAFLAAAPALAQAPEAPLPAEPAAPDRPTPEECDARFDACLEECDRSMPNESGEMLCTGCGWDCNVTHKKCLGGAYYRKMFGGDEKKGD